MADWFDRIASQRLDPAPRLRPALAPALAPRRAPPTFEPDAPDLEVHADPPARTQTAVAHVGARQGTSTRADALGAQEGPARVDMAKSRSAAASAARTPTVERDERASALRAAPLGARQVAATLAPSLASAPDEAPSPARPAHRSPARAQALQQHASTRPAATLSEARLEALRAQAPKATAPAPVVHVHIDRLEVRAPAAPARPAPALRSRAKSADTLADYLRAGVRR